MADAEFSTWLTKQQAADAIGVTTKSVEAFAQAGKLEQARWQPGGRGQTVRVYHPDDVARLAAERRQGPLPAFLVPGTTGSTNGNGHGAIQTLPSVSSASPSGEDILRLVFAMAQRALTAEAEKQGEKDQKAEKSVLTLFLTVDEAAVIANLTPRDLRRAIRSGELAARHKERRDWRTWRIKRKDLEAL